MFQSGFAANAGTVAAILDKEDVIVSDRLNHASIIDGARLSRAEIKVFEHKDADHADALLTETARPGRRQLLVTDGVFSMDGDIAPLPPLVEVAEEHAAIMMLDDAHASGCSAPGGRDRGPLRPARAGRRPGGNVVEGDRGARRLHRRSPPPDPVAREPWAPVPLLHERAPAVTAACIEALDILRDEPSAWSACGEHAGVQGRLHDLGFDTGMSETPITPVITGDEEKTQEFARRLFEQGVFTPAIVFPTVAKGRPASGRS